MSLLINEVNTKIMPAIAIEISQKENYNIKMVDNYYAMLLIITEKKKKCFISVLEACSCYGLRRSSCYGPTSLNE